MRILDRYIVRSFLEPMIVATAIIVGLYMVGDAFGKLDNFLQEAGSLRDALFRMAGLYFVRIPVFVAPMLPIGMLIGAAYGVSQLSSHNELSAMHACGVSLWRIVAPVYVVAAAVAFLGLANYEYLIPRVEAATARDLSRWTGSDEFKKVVIQPKEKLLVTMNYNVARDEARNLSILDEATGLVIRAERGEYRGGYWELRSVQRGEREFLEKFKWETDLTPRDVRLRLIEPAMAPLRVLREAISRDPGNNEYLLAYHLRLAYPFTGLVLMGLALPFVIGHERIRRHRALGIGLCLIVCGVFYTVQYIANDLGRTGNLWPAAAAWLPIVIFGSLGLYLLDALHR